MVDHLFEGRPDGIEKRASRHLVGTDLGAVLDEHRDLPGSTRGLLLRRTIAPHR